MISNYGIDTEGDGTRKDLLETCVIVNRVKKYEEYIYTTCALDGPNLCMSLLTTLVMGDRGILKRKHVAMSTCSLQCVAIV